MRKFQAPRALSIEELTDELLKNDKKVVFLGDGVKVHKEYIKDKMGDRALFAPVSALEQRASGLATAAKNKKAVSCYELSPIYLRKPQAERELEEKENVSTGK